MYCQEAGEAHIARYVRNSRKRDTSSRYVRNSRNDTQDSVYSRNDTQDSVYSRRDLHPVVNSRRYTLPGIYSRRYTLPGIYSRRDLIPVVIQQERPHPGGNTAGEDTRMYTSRRGHSVCTPAVRYTRG